MHVEPVLTLAAIARVVKMSWTANESQMWFFYTYESVAFFVLPAMTLVMRRSTAGVEFRKDGRAKLCLTRHAEYEDCGMTAKFPTKAWRERLGNRGNYFK